MNSVTVTLLEVRLRVLYCVSSWIVCLSICYHSTTELLYVLGRPVYQLHDRFQFFDTGEAFATWITVSLVWACLGVLPILLYHIWCFMIPSRYNFERHIMSRYFGIAFGLLIIECALIYGWIFPAVYHFLITIPSSGDTLLSNYGVEFAARLGTYVGFWVKFFTIVVVLCQFPVVLGVVCIQDGINGSQLATLRRWVVMVLIVCSALVSPPDIVSQLAITLWGLFLFEITVVYGCFFDCVKRIVEKK